MAVSELRGIAAKIVQGAALSTLELGGKISDHVQASFEVWESEFQRCNGRRASITYGVRAMLQHTLGFTW